MSVYDVYYSSMCFLFDSFDQCRDYVSPESCRKRYIGSDVLQYETTVARLQRINENWKTLTSFDRGYASATVCRNITFGSLVLHIEAFFPGCNA